MKALSILQPYAWLIANGFKDIENRTWSTPFQGRFMVHAGKRYPKSEHADDIEMLADMGIALPPYDHMDRGGFVGAATITDCVREHPSRWKGLGSWGFVLEKQRILPFVPFPGRLGWFDVPAEVIVRMEELLEMES